MYFCTKSKTRGLVLACTDRLSWILYHRIHYVNLSERLPRSNWWIKTRKFPPCGARQSVKVIFDFPRALMDVTVKRLSIVDTLT